MKVERLDESIKSFEPIALKLTIDTAEDIITLTNHLGRSARNHSASTYALFDVLNDYCEECNLNRRAHPSYTS